jgi:hypothetical protein
MDIITLEDSHVYSEAAILETTPVHFLRILQWWGKTAKGPIFLALPPG